MKMLICVVEDVFQITGRGCVIVPGLPIGAEIQVRIGDALVLRRPDGSEVATSIRGMESGVRRENGGIAILLADVTKADVPIGTEVWLA